MEPEVLRDIVDEVWEAWVGQRLSTRIEPSELARERPVQVRVAYHGAYRGTLLLDVPASAARELGGGMMHVLENSVTAEELEDVARELASICAGNLLAVLPRGTTASLPWAVRGSTRRQSDGATRLSYRFPGGLRVRLLAEEAARPSPMEREAQA